MIAHLGQCLREDQIIRSGVRMNQISEGLETEWAMRHEEPAHPWVSYIPWHRDRWVIHQNENQEHSESFQEPLLYEQPNLPLIIGCQYTVELKHFVLKSWWDKSCEITICIISTRWCDQDPKLAKDHGWMWGWVFHPLYSWWLNAHMVQWD